MAESQNTEYKESWRDEYLKWVCGFANARGGKIYIGVRDDGEVVGVSDSKKLLEDIPNKIKDTMGIIADVNLLSKDDKDYIEIKVNSSSYPVSYKGEYHYRSGSTKQQLRGASLTEFLVEKTGYRWDAAAVENIGVDELDSESFEIFRKEAVRTGRMSKKDLNISNEELLDHLDLLIDGKLKRAAVMLFYKKPGRIISGCCVKIGKFGKGADLQYQDTVEGSLFYIADRVIDLIYTKYLKASITYKHDVRVETYPFPREGVREAIYNALGHNNYVASEPILIRIEDDAMYISNKCVLPRGWTVETLMEKHKSSPFNPSIANAFYRAGYIEAWGRGIQKMLEACKELGSPAPEYMIKGEDLTVKFIALASAVIPNNNETGKRILDMITAKDGIFICVMADKIAQEYTILDDDLSIEFADLSSTIIFNGHYVQNNNESEQRILGRFVAKKGISLCIITDKTEPEYTIKCEDLTVKFSVLSNTVILNEYNVQKDNEIEQRILDMIAVQNDISMSVMADQMRVSRKTVQRAINNLKETGRIRRNGGKRFGFWEVIDKQ